MNFKNRSKPKTFYLQLGINGKHHFWWKIPYTFHKPKHYLKKPNKRTKDINPKKHSPRIVVITTWKMMNNKRIKEVMNNRSTKEMMSNNTTKGTIKQLKRKWTTRGWPSRHWVTWGPWAQYTRKWLGKWWAIRGPKRLIRRKWLPSPPPLSPHCHPHYHHHCHSPSQTIPMIQKPKNVNNEQQQYDQRNNEQ